MKVFKVFGPIVLLFLFSEYAFSTQGCLVNNTFYVSYLGMIRTTDGSFSGNKRVYNDSGANYPINYSGSESCNTVPVNRYGNGGPDRNGDLCFVMSSSTYNSYPTSGGVKIAPNYPSRNGTLQDFTITCVTSLPLDDYIPFLVLLTGVAGFICVRKDRFAITLISN
ncbi:hypothetical protein DU508_11535 [Pedobacter chinensis]|uniref:PEP-CTERM sorting domain-containing protein n=1 Tax=Pedobacter chinensis TaxID=2282421 RepID=A0A369PZQ0_9SPHI|nr:hypothetical protein [Pedobacter chinensis]RDC56236.1 hypothetical protein DU508_11535 [Pedobacter chinensis]